MTSGVDWDSDPDFKKIRDQFIESFAEREKALLEAIAAAPASDEQIAKIRLVAHRLAGAAESYGFAALTQVSGALDDWICSGQAKGASELLGQKTAMLARALALARTSRQDPTGLLESAEYKALFR